MMFFMKLRTMLVASALAGTILGAPALQRVALAVDLCTPALCGTMTCSADGKTWNYKPGDTIVVRGADGKLRHYMCDGHTGRWIQVGGPVLQQPGSESPPPPPPPTAQQ
jgi:hypothetical protein